MLRISYKKILISIIRKYLSECKIYLFGSRARKTHSVGSDVDLAVDAGQKVDFRILRKIKDDIEESNIPYFVDIIDLHNVSEEFKESIEKDKISLE